MWPASNNTVLKCFYTDKDYTKLEQNIKVNIKKTDLVLIEEDTWHIF